eukprot:s777_g45.t1
MLLLKSGECCGMRIAYSNVLSQSWESALATLAMLQLEGAEANLNLAANADTVGPTMCNAAITACSKGAQWDMALHLLSAMPLRRIAPTAATWHLQPHEACLVSAIVPSSTAAKLLENWTSPREFCTLASHGFTICMLQNVDGDGNGDGGVGGWCGPPNPFMKRPICQWPGDKDYFRAVLLNKGVLGIASLTDRRNRPKKSRNTGFQTCEWARGGFQFLASMQANAFEKISFRAKNLAGLGRAVQQSR